MTGCYIRYKCSWPPPDFQVLPTLLLPVRRPRVTATSLGRNSAETAGKQILQPLQFSWRGKIFFSFPRIIACFNMHLCSQVQFPVFLQVQAIYTASITSFHSCWLQTAVSHYWKTGLYQQRIFPNVVKQPQTDALVLLSI